LKTDAEVEMLIGVLYPSANKSPMDSENMSGKNTSIMRAKRKRLAMQREAIGKGGNKS